MNDNELYNKYQDSIPEYETFKSIKNKKLKSLLFTGWIAKFGSKEIRKQMNIPYSTYDYNVRHYTGEVEEETETKRAGRPKNAKNIIEAEFEEIVAIDQNITLALTADKQINKPFISVEWMNTPESIFAQLEALATVLKFESGNIKVKIEVLRQ